MRALNALSFLLVVVTATQAGAKDVCSYIRKAEAVGVIVDRGAGGTVAAYREDSGIAAPVLTWSTKTIGPGDTVSDFLIQEGLSPDKFNLDVTKTLNPSLNNLDHLKIGGSVSIPTIEKSMGQGGALDGFKTWPALAEQWGNNSGASEKLVTFLNDPGLLTRFGQQSGMA